MASHPLAGVRAFLKRLSNFHAFSVNAARAGAVAPRKSAQRNSLPQSNRARTPGIRRAAAQAIGLIAALMFPLIALAAVLAACFLVPPLSLLDASPFSAALRWSAMPRPVLSIQRVLFWSGADVLLVSAATAYWVLRLRRAMQSGDMRAKRFLLRLLLCVPAIAGVMIARIAHVTSLSGHGIEIAAAMAGMIASALLIATIIGRSASTFAVLAIAMVVSLTAALPPWATFAAALGAIAGQYPARFVRNRRTVVRCAVFVMGACGVVAGVAALLTGQSPGASISTGLEAVLTGCLGAALWFTLLTMLERPFQLTTPLGLLELLDPTRTILERFSRQAPGTFAHSLMVGHLAASAADAIGADALLCRVAAQYHDIGKLCRAQFFKENQQGGNVHDRLAPSLSAIIVNSHVRDGERMAKELGLPPVIQDIITQHHGTTLMRYFYYQAADGMDPAKAGALQSQFRYPGPKPQSREAGIMMMADACEAASRTLRNPNRESVRVLVDDIVDDRIADKQLDECPLTLRDISAIRSALTDVICATMHERVEYPGAIGASGAPVDAERVPLDDLTLDLPPAVLPSESYENFDPAVLSLDKPPLGLGDRRESVIGSGEQPETIAHGRRPHAKRFAHGFAPAARPVRRGTQRPPD